MLEILGPEEAAEDAASGAVERGAGATLLDTGETWRPHGQHVSEQKSRTGTGPLLTRSCPRDSEMQSVPAG